MSGAGPGIHPMSVDATPFPHGPAAPAAARAAVDVALAGRLAHEGLAEMRLLVSKSSPTRCATASPAAARSS